MKKEQLIQQVVDKINLLNRIQIDRLDTYRFILKDGSDNDLNYLIDILDKEIGKYSEEFQSASKDSYKGYKTDEVTELELKDYNNQDYSDGNGY